MNPFFSILIASYNRPKFLQKCIHSILKSDYKDYEIIISDDNSPKKDDIKKIVEKLKNSNIRFYQQKKNLREPNNKNFLSSKAKGLYNIQIGDDDILYPDSLSKIKKYIENNPKIDIYTFGYKVIDEKDRLIYSRRAPRKLLLNISNIYISKQIYISDIFPFWMYHPSIFCSRNGLELEFPYSNLSGIGEDFQFFYEIFNASKQILIIPEYIFSWRKIQDLNSENFQINQSLSTMSNFQARELIYNNYFSTNKALNSRLKDFVMSYSFRKKFIYDSIIYDNSYKGSLQDVKMSSDKHQKEFNNLIVKPAYLKKINNPLYSRMFRFISLFGFLGLLEIFKVIFQRISYQIKLKFC